MKRFVLTGDETTPEELACVALLIRVTLDDEEMSDTVREKMENAAALIERFIEVISPLLQEVEAAVLDLNTAMDAESILQQMRVENPERAH